MEESVDEAMTPPEAGKAVVGGEEEKKEKKKKDAKKEKEQKKDPYDVKSENWTRKNKDQLLFERLVKKWTK